MPPTPFPVRALYGYEAAEEDDLPFAPGQRVMVDEVLDDDWYHGYYIDPSSEKRLEGIFPISYVEIEVPPSRPSRPRPKEQRSSEPKTDESASKAAPSSDLSSTSKEPIASTSAPTPAHTHASLSDAQSSAAPAHTHASAHDPAPASGSISRQNISQPRRTVVDEEDDWGDNSDSEPEEKKIVLKPPTTSVSDSSSKDSSSKDSNSIKSDTVKTDDSKSSSANKRPSTQTPQETSKDLPSTPGSASKHSQKADHFDDDATSESEAAAFHPGSSDLAYVPSKASSERDEQRPFHEAPVAVLKTSSKKVDGPGIETQAYGEIDAIPRPSRPVREAPLTVDEESDSEIPSVPAEEVHEQSTLGSGISRTEADFKTRLARFNARGDADNESPKPEPKKLERHHTFGRDFNFGEQEEERKKPNRDPDEYKPSVSLKERIAMLQKSQQQEAETAEADVAAEERRKLRRAQIAAEAEANKQARAEAEVREAEEKAKQDIARQEKEALEAAEAEKQHREAAERRAKELESHAGVPVPPQTHPRTGSSDLSPHSTVESLPSQLSDLHVGGESQQAPPPVPKPKESVSSHDDGSAGHEERDANAAEDGSDDKKTEDDGEHAEPRRKSSDLRKSALGFGFGQPFVPSENAGSDNEGEQEHDDDDDNAEARRIALRERMARLASSTGGMNLGMIMGGGGFGAAKGSGVPKRERRISRSEYDAMSPAEIEAAEARREAEQSAPINIFGTGAPPPKGVMPSEDIDEEGRGQDEYEGDGEGEYRETADDHGAEEDAQKKKSNEYISNTPSSPSNSATGHNAKLQRSTSRSSESAKRSSFSGDSIGSPVGSPVSAHSHMTNTSGSPRMPRREMTHSNSEKFLASPRSDEFHDTESEFRFDDGFSNGLMETAPAAPAPPTAVPRAAPIPPAPSARPGPVAPPAHPATATPSAPSAPSPPSAPSAPSHPSSAPRAPAPAPGATGVPPASPVTAHPPHPAGARPPPPPASHLTRAPPPPPAHPASVAPPVAARPPPPVPPHHDETRVVSPPPPAGAAPEISHYRAPPPAPPAPTHGQQRAPPVPPAAPAPPPAHPATAAAPPPPPRTLSPLHGAPPPPPAHPPAVHPRPTSTYAPPPPVTSPPPAEPVGRPAPPPPHAPAPPSRSSTFGNTPPPPRPVARPVEDDGLSSHVQPTHAPHPSNAADYSHHRQRSSFDSTRSQGSYIQTPTSPRASGPSWTTVPAGIPPNLVSKGETFRVKDNNGQRDVLVIHPGWTQTLSVFSLATGQLIHQQDLPAPAADATKLKQVSSRVGSHIVQAANHIVAKDGHDSSGEWCMRVLQSVPAVVLGGQREPDKPDPSSIGIELYTNMGNASVHQLDEIRPGDICVCEDAMFQGSRGPLQKYQKTYPSNYFVVSDWDGSKRKLHFVDSKKEGLRLNDLKMGVVRIFRPIDRQYLDL